MTNESNDDCGCGSNHPDENRRRFEQLDLEATEAVVRIIRTAARLAEEKPELFFKAISSGREASGAEGDPTERAAQSLLGQLGPLLGQPEGGPLKILETLIDLLKEEKKYWKPPPPGWPPPPEGPPPPPPEGPPPYGPGDPPFFPEEPGRRQCRVISLRAPTRRTGCRSRIDATTGLASLQEGFAMEAEFTDGADGSECRCCEYRQYVCGEFRVDGTLLTKMLANPDDPVNGAPRMLQPFPHFEEDGLTQKDLAGQPAGTNVFYGHRNEGSEDDSDRYLPDRAAGCSYRGTDVPGISKASPAAALSVNLTFLGVIVDVCNGNALRAARVWTVKCSNR